MRESERERKKEDRNLEEDNSTSSRIVREQFALFFFSRSLFQLIISPANYVISERKWIERETQSDF